MRNYIWKQYNLETIWNDLLENDMIWLHVFVHSSFRGAKEVLKRDFYVFCLVVIRLTEEMLMET